jgi:hypothetical protein
METIFFLYQQQLHELDGSHSLGTLIEWKLDEGTVILERGYPHAVPTRWGH